MHATGFGRLPPSLVRAAINAALKLGNSAEDIEKQLAMQRRCVERRVIEHLVIEHLEVRPDYTKSLNVTCRSWVLRASRSSLVTTSRSPDANDLSSLASCGRSDRAPLIFSANTLV